MRGTREVPGAVVRERSMTSTKRVAILQSNYIPWRGYFDLIDSVDEFMLYDDRQYTTNDWRNRNRIKTAQGVQWLTIPVRHQFGQRIDEALIGDRRWATKHWRTLVQNYAAAAHFGDYRERIEGVYLEETDRLSVVNRRFIETICELLEITTTITSSGDYEGVGDRGERVLSLCQAAGAGTYLTGPGARSYLDEQTFEDAGIAVEWMHYEGYPDYPQLHGPFEPAVTVLDLLFNTGPDARQFLKRRLP
jgi:hypothetical protein